MDSARLINVAIDPGRSLWLVEDNGIYEYTFLQDSISMEPARVIQAPRGLHTHVHRDYAENIWVTTLGEGVFLFKNPLLRPLTLPLEASLMDAYQHEALGVLLLTVEGELWAFQDGRYTLIRQVSFPVDQSTQILPGFNSDRLWVAANKTYLLDLKGPEYLLDAKSYFLLDDSSGFIFSKPRGGGFIPWQDTSSISEQLRIFNSDEGGEFFVQNRFVDNRINDGVLIQEDTVLIGYQKGLGYFFLGSQTWQHINNPRVTKEVNVIERLETARGKEWYFLGGDDLLMAFSSQGDTLNFSSTLLQGINLYSMALVADTLLWLGTDQGLYSYSVNLDSLSTQFLGSLSLLEGLSNQSVRDIELYGDSLWVKTDAGYAYGNVEKLLKSQEGQSPVPRVKKMWVNNILTPTTPDLALAAGVYNIRVAVAPMQVVNPGQLAFQYRLDSTEAWTSFNGSELQLFGLSAGTYSLEIRSLARKGQTSDSAHMFITIPAFWWQWPWLWGCMVLLVGLAIFRWLRNRNQRIKEKAQSEVKIAQMELTALKAQMNPHFIFNALSSIQRFILASDTLAANEYLTKYSRLTRMVLNPSDKTLVPLEDEVQLLENYIALECLRLSHRFTYEIKVDPALDPKRVELPALMLQIFVENAVWHGLSSLERPGQLLLSFSKEEHFLLVLLKDNGIGRKAAAERNPRRGTSRGSQLVSDRLAMLNETVYQNQASIKIVDLYDAEQQPAGTEVHLRLPLSVY